MERVLILGVPIDAVTTQEAVAAMLRFLQGDKPCHVMTPNSEMLVEARSNPAFKILLGRTALNLPDGAGLIFASRWKGRRLPSRVAGADAVRALCQSLSGDIPVFLLGGREGVAQKAAAALEMENPHLSVVGTYSGSPKQEEAGEILARIQAASPKLLLVAFGAPAQDLWIDRHLSKIPSVRLAMGVGGTFDFLAGVRRRAPLFLQRLGLEWMWRLVQEPSRFRRIWNAVVVFPWLVWRERRRT